MPHLRTGVVARFAATLATTALAIFTLATTCSNPIAPEASGSSGQPFTSASFTFGVENSWIRVQNIGAGATRRSP